MKKQSINLIFILCILCFLLASIVRTALFPIDINVYENRKAVTLAKPKLSSYLDGSLQANMQDALADQAFLAQEMKGTYNISMSKYVKTALGTLIKNSHQKYIGIGKFFLYGDDYILYAPYDFEEHEEALLKRCEYFNKLALNYPEQDIYFYYIEKEIDTDFETGKRIEIFDYMAKNTVIPDSNKKAFRINGFEEYEKLFYKTDHHWNADGSYKGYKEVINMLIPNEAEFVRPIEALDVSSVFHGTKTMNEGTSSYSEIFKAYRYDYPEMSIKINGIKALDYGRQDEFFAGTDEKITYGKFYGDDYGEVIFDTNDDKKDNLLVIGESHDNAILKLIASHFNRTVSIDMRNYYPHMGKAFSLSECVRENDIDKILFIGSVGFYIDDTFEVGD